MTSDGDSVVDKIKSKAAEVKGKVSGTGQDADPEDVDYEPTPDQEISHDGMVVLSKGQVESRDADDATGGDGSGTDS